MSVEAVDQVLATADNIYKYSSSNPKGPTVAVQNTQMPGKPVVVVDAATGKVVVTVMSKVKK